MGIISWIVLGGIAHHQAQRPDGLHHRHRRRYRRRSGGRMGVQPVRRTGRDRFQPAQPARRLCRRPDCVGHSQLNLSQEIT